MPEAFISSTTPSSHPDSADNLLLMISSRPFVDPKSGWLLQGSGGVSFAIYLLLRLIFTGRYLVDYPSVFNFPFNQTTAIQKTRTVARACTALLICDIDTSLERARRVTQSVRHSNELRFVPYPQPVPQACLPAGPSCGSSSGIGLESTTVHKTADTRAKLKAKQAIELLRGVDANDPTNVGLWDNGNQRSDRQKVYMEAPWLIFFKEHYEKAGKSLPNHLQAVVQNSLKRRIQVDPSCSVENIAGKTNRLQIGHNLPSSRSTKLSNLLEGKRHVSGGSDTHPERKRTKGGANSPSEIVEYIVVSDSDSE
ncbi:hypothetical protein RSOLAG1IB_11462 [Rhizoctonia solani AG-1 IB]|uniref:Uncharacterized protein n=1 Tax=Thanatephorus cucumeris (strain AG1-IB / isolate 7/3/14) TaxID=1108050 RepID=A0A0B7F6M3_THACB|nr:hypothetical protein RSOLAG1IB_11462 [Rhizoctonia solani AG-1 IB]